MQFWHLRTGSVCDTGPCCFLDISDEDDCVRAGTIGKPPTPIPDRLPCFDPGPSSLNTALTVVLVDMLPVSDICLNNSRQDSRTW